MRNSFHIAAAMIVGSALFIGAIRADAPLWEALPSLGNALPAQESPREATMFFVGDIMLSRAIGSIMEREDNYAYPFHLVREQITSADIAFANLESPISDKGKNVGSIYSFRADPRAIEGLADAGFDVVSFANNHVGDYGPEALLDTLARLRAQGVHAVGAGETSEEAHTPKIVEVNRLRVGFLAYTNLAPAFYLKDDAHPAIADIVIDTVRTDIADAKIRYNADLVVVSYHWGEEYQTHRNDWQERIAHETIDAGALLVIGHHPHVVQEVERYNGGVIAYSLGNFVFDQNFSPDTQKGLALRVNVREGEITSTEELPVAFTSTYQPYFK